MLFDDGLNIRFFFRDKLQFVIAYEHGIVNAKPPYFHKSPGQDVHGKASQELNTIKCITGSRDDGKTRFLSHNLNFVEFDTFRKQAGLNSFNLSPDNKLELIARLSKSLKTTEKAKKEVSLRSLYGSWASEQSADELIDELKKARNFIRIFAFTFSKDSLVKSRKFFPLIRHYAKPRTGTV